MHCCPRDGCSAVFPRPYRLAAHLLTHDNKKGFKCEHEGCGREYTNKSHLLRHFKSAHESTDKTANFNCTECWRVYSNQQNLKRHLKIHHTSTVYTCKICWAQFRKKHMLTAHEYKHTSVKGFSCDYCSQSFITLHEKKRHLRFHKKTYKCGDCDEIFHHWSTYQEHIKNFHKDKEYICHHCARHFKVRAQIVRHVKFHNDDNRVYFICPVERCQKFYTTKFNLKQHIMSAHEGATFDCTICEAKLSTKATLKKHLETHVVVKKEITIQTKKERKTRKDKGVPKEPVAIKIAGINLATKWQDLTATGGEKDVLEIEFESTVTESAVS